MPFAFKYQEMMNKRKANCQRVCVILLRVAPFQQKDLRQWWVKNMVFNTWQDQRWELENHASHLRVDQTN